MLMKKSVNGVPPPSVVLASPGAERSEAERSDAERSVAPGEAKTMPDPEVVVVQVTCRIQPILPPCQGIRSSDHDKTTQASLKEHRMVPVVCHPGWPVRPRRPGAEQCFPPALAGRHLLLGPRRKLAHLHDLWRCVDTRRGERAGLPPSHRDMRLGHIVRAVLAGDTRSAGHARSEERRVGGKRVDLG